MLVYVLNKDGQPLMPTERCGKVRRLLKSNEAKVVKRCPFTIQLLYVAEQYTHPITLGVDAGYKHIGLSATTNKTELYSGEVELRSDIGLLLSTRKQFRKIRRNRKTRYRKPRFLNRVSYKKECLLAPSVRQKIKSHLTVIDNITKILPITKIIVETASFDIQKIKNPSMSGVEYQQGEQLDFRNVREYVLFRDHHLCQCCKGKSKDKILNVHHIESRKTGGNAPNNLITLCETCHKGYHNGTIKLPNTIRRGMSFKDAAFMGIMRWNFYNALKDEYPNIEIRDTRGYITKHTRISNGLPKEHYIDAKCISGNPLAQPLGYYFYQKKVRCHNRQIHKAKILAGGIKKLNQAGYVVNGYRLFDKVLYQNKPYFVFGRRTSGFFDIRTLRGEKVNNGSISCNKIQLIEKSKKYLTEIRNLGCPFRKENVALTPVL